MDECDRFLQQFGYAFQPNVHPDTPFYRGFFETSPQSTEEMDRRCGEFLDRLYASIDEGSIWCDDTPLNMNHVESLSRFFPDQSLVFVHVLRNPLDTVSSFIKHPASWTSEGFRTSLNWLESTVTKIGHETGHGTADIYNVRLEDLVENPEEIMTDLFWSLGVEFDARQTKTDLTRANYGRSAKELSPQERKEVWDSVGWFYEPFGYSFEGDKVVAK